MALLAAVSVSVLLGCSDGATSPQLEDPQVTLQDVFSAARAASPLPTRDLVMIGVLDEGRTANSALVAYHGRSAYHLYRFHRVRGNWQRAALVTMTRAALDATLEGSEGDGAGGYLTTIAKAYNQTGAVLDEDWFINAHNQSGDYMTDREYVTDLPWSATFFGGTETHNDSTFQVSFLEWKYYRVNVTPTGSGSCLTTTCSTAIVSGGISYPANRLELYFRLNVIPPVNVSISGPGLAGDTIKVAGQKQWTAHATGGTGTYTYQWERSDNDGGTWYGVGTSAALTMVVDTGAHRFDLRVTASSGGKTGVSTGTVQVNADAFPLEVTISGPTQIWSAATHQWTANVSGGTGTYSYEWFHKIHQYYPKPTSSALCETDWSSVGTLPSYSTYVDENDYDFMVKVTVTSGSQEVSTWVKVFPFDDDDPLCPTR